MGKVRDIFLQPNVSLLVFFLSKQNPWLLTNIPKIVFIAKTTCFTRKVLEQTTFPEISGCKILSKLGSLFPGSRLLNRLLSGG